MALASGAIWFASVFTPGSFLGGDLAAYTAAAQRLVESGSPYHPQLIAGPIENRVENVPIGYLYPPVLAQMFVPVSDASVRQLAVPWMVAQVLALLVLLPVVYRRAGGALNPLSLVLIMSLLFGTEAGRQAVAFGNVSGCIAVAVAAMLISPPAIQGVLAAIITAVKTLPAPILLAAVVAPQSRLPAIATAAGVVLTSALTAPEAWVAWFGVLPNLLLIQPAQGDSNLAPIQLLSSVVGAPLGTLIAFAFVASGTLLGVARARRDLSPRAVAASAVAYLFASSTLWEHYAVVLYPLILAAWPTSGMIRRAAFLGFALTQTRFLGLADPATTATLERMAVILAAAALLVWPLTSEEKERVSAEPVPPADATVRDRAHSQA